MRKYLATLHKRPDHHKKRFAVLVSGGFTLIIFAIWSLVTFGQSGTPAAATEAAKELTPFESIKNDLQSVKDSLDPYGRP